MRVRQACLVRRQGGLQKQSTEAERDAEPASTRQGIAELHEIVTDSVRSSDLLLADEPSLQRRSRRRTGEALRNGDATVRNGWQHSEGASPAGDLGGFLVRSRKLRTGSSEWCE